MNLNDKEIKDKKIKNDSKKSKKKSNLKNIKKKKRVDKESESIKKQEAAIREANYIAARDPIYQGKSKFHAKASEIITVLFAAVIGSFATVVIMLPSGLTYGGITGIARMIQVAFNVNYSLVYYALAIAVPIICWICIGFEEVRKIILLSFAYPTLILIFELLDLRFIENNDTFLSAIFCGVAFGVSNGLTFKAGFSSGGTDSIAKIIKLKKIPYVSMNDITFVINVIIVVISAFVMSVNIALYAIVTMYISMKVGEGVMFGMSDKIVELSMITENPDDIKNYIINELGRGVTSTLITGEYTGVEKKQLNIICSPRESFIIKRYLAKNDPSAFVSVIKVNSVWGTGRGFSNIDEMDN